MILVAQLDKSYGGFGLRAVSLELGAGRVGAVVGGSGAGKSTLLRCLVGLEPFDRGSITVGGATLHGEQSAGPARHRVVARQALRGAVGLVFQSFELFPHLTVMENCILAPRLVRGTPRAAAASEAVAILEQLGVHREAHRHPETLSGGQRQRVAIARALCMRPAVLLYDEPTSALDPSLRREVHGTLAQVRATGVTQLVVTHDLDLAREAADEVFVLAAGELVEHGAPADVLTRPSHAATRRLIGRTE